MVYMVYMVLRQKYLQNKGDCQDVLDKIKAIVSIVERYHIHGSLIALEGRIIELSQFVDACYYEKGMDLNKYPGR